MPDQSGGLKMKILKSKKFQVFSVSVVMLVLVQLVGLDAATAESIKDGLVKLAATYLIGQGIADHGKSAAEVAK